MIKLDLLSLNILFFESDDYYNFYYRLVFVFHLFWIILFIIPFFLILFFVGVNLESFIISSH